MVRTPDIIVQRDEIAKFQVFEKPITCLVEVVDTTKAVIKLQAFARGAVQ